MADLLAHCKQNEAPENIISWLENNLNYNSLGGKCNRGMATVDTCSILLGRALSEEEFFLSATLGWAVELLQAFFLVSDDIMDSSITRRNNPCWYLLPQVRMIAINDAFMLESSIYVLLKKYFRNHQSYVDLLELFHEVTFQTELGQTSDLLTAEEVSSSNFSLEKYIFIVTYKTAYYSFYLPVALALHFCNKATPKNLRTAKEILIPMGELFQVQDDYLDNFADPAVLGKVGTDIKDNKCSWLVVQALMIATPGQRKVLEDNYGRKGDKEEAAVKTLYDELNLQKTYENYEEKRTNEIRDLISKVDEQEGLEKDVFEMFLKKITKRSK
ncbi:Farnesyl pyrophosphate synthetase [Botryosphaeria dothidea]